MLFIVGCTARARFPSLCIMLVSEHCSSIPCRRPRRFSGKRLTVAPHMVLTVVCAGRPQRFSMKRLTMDFIVCSAKNVVPELELEPKRNTFLHLDRLCNTFLHLGRLCSTFLHLGRSCNTFLNLGRLCNTLCSYHAAKSATAQVW